MTTLLSPYTGVESFWALISEFGTTLEPLSQMMIALHQSELSKLKFLHFYK